MPRPGLPPVAEARALLRPAERRRAGRFLVEGPQAVREARAAGLLLGLWATREAADRHPELTDGLRVQVVGDRALAGLADTPHPQGLVGYARTVDVGLDVLTAAGPRLVAVLVDPRDPGNAGTVLRSADAAGADGVVFADGPAGGAVDPHNGKCVRASTGSLFHLPVVTGRDVAAVVDALRACGCRILAADGSAATDLDAAGELLAGPVAWLFGTEAAGLGQAGLALADHAVRVPIYGRAESLNLATAAALCLYASARAARTTGVPPAGRS